MIAGREASVVGMPVPGFASLDAVTTEQDWVVTGSRSGQPFRMYVSPHVSREEAIWSVASSLQITPETLDWITAARREQVEQCVRMDGDWLRSRTL